MANEMTRAEFYARYGDVEVIFSNHHKHVFTYAATLPDGKRLSVCCCGDGDAAYRNEVTAGLAEKVGILEPYTGSVYEDGKVVDLFYDY